MVLQHIQVNEYQSWNISQCALAMMFDLYSCIPDSLRLKVCDLYTKHPTCIQQTLKSVDNRSGNNTLMNLFEKWLGDTHIELFEDANDWCEVNSLRIGDELSSGICMCCGQTDTPDLTLLCEVESCPGAMHSFCCPVATEIDTQKGAGTGTDIAISMGGNVDIDLDSPWYCNEHKSDR